MGRNRVYFRDDTGRMHHVPVGWTSEGEPDAFKATLDDGELDARLYAKEPSVGRQRAMPDCAWIDTERRRVGVTLELLHLEHLEKQPETCTIEVAQRGKQPASSTRDGTFARNGPVPRAR